MFGSPDLEAIKREADLAAAGIRPAIFNLCAALAGCISSLWRSDEDTFVIFFLIGVGNGVAWLVGWDTRKKAQKRLEMFSGH